MTVFLEKAIFAQLVRPSVYGSLRKQTQRGLNVLKPVSEIRPAKRNEDMTKYRLHMSAAILFLLLLPSFIFAKELMLTLEYYQTSNREVVDSVYKTELINEGQKQQIYDDLIIADEGSRRTLNTLLEIFKWYQIDQFRKALIWSRVFTQDFIVSENSISSQNVILPGGQLDASFTVKKRRNHAVPLGMSIIYDDRALFFSIPKTLPMDKFVLLHDRNTREDGNEELEVLILRIIHHETEEPAEDQELQ